MCVYINIILYDIYLDKIIYYNTLIEIKNTHFGINTGKTHTLKRVYMNTTK